MCYYLQTCTSVVNMVVMGVVLEQSLMVISATGILLYAVVSPFYRSALLLSACKVFVRLLQVE